MVDLSTAIQELNDGRILFEYQAADVCSTEGEIVIYLERLAQFESIGLEPEEIIQIIQAAELKELAAMKGENAMSFTLPSATAVNDAQWQTVTPNLYALRFSDTVMLQVYVPRVAKYKPHAKLIPYAMKDGQCVFDNILFQTELPEITGEFDEEVLKTNALKAVTDYMTLLAMNAAGIAAALKAHM